MDGVRNMPRKEIIGRSDTGWMEYQRGLVNVRWEDGWSGVE